MRRSPLHTLRIHICFDNPTPQQPRISTTLDPLHSALCCLLVSFLFACAAAQPTPFSPLDVIGENGLWGVGFTNHSVFPDCRLFFLGSQDAVLPHIFDITYAYVEEYAGSDITEVVWRSAPIVSNYTSGFLSVPEVSFITLSDKGRIEVLYSVFDNDSVVDVAPGLSLSIPGLSVKFTLKLSGWSYLQVGNTIGLRLFLNATSPLKSIPDAPLASGKGYFDIGIGQVAARFLDKVLIGSVLQSIVQISSSVSAQGVAVHLQFPYFGQEELVYDPDFSILLNSPTSQRSSDDGMLGIGQAASVAVTVLICGTFSAVVFIIAGVGLAYAALRWRVWRNRYRLDPGVDPEMQRRREGTVNFNDPLPDKEGEKESQGEDPATQLAAVGTDEGRVSGDPPVTLDELSMTASDDPLLPNTNTGVDQQAETDTPRITTEQSLDVFGDDASV